MGGVVWDGGMGEMEGGANVSWLGLLIWMEYEMG